MTDVYKIEHDDIIGDYIPEVLNSAEDIAFQAFERPAREALLRDDLRRIMADYLCADEVYNEEEEEYEYNPDQLGKYTVLSAYFKRFCDEHNIEFRPDLIAPRMTSAWIYMWTSGKVLELKDEEKQSFSKALTLADKFTIESTDDGKLQITIGVSMSPERRETLKWHL